MCYVCFSLRWTLKIGFDFMLAHFLLIVTVSCGKLDLGFGSMTFLGEICYNQLIFEPIWFQLMLPKLIKAMRHEDTYPCCHSGVLHTEKSRSYSSYKYIPFTYYQSLRNSYNVYTFMIRSNRNLSEFFPPEYPLH